MKSSHNSPALILKRVVSTLGFSLVFAISSLPCAQAADTPAQHAAAEKLPKLPFKTSFNKVKQGEEGPYTLRLKNTSKEAITAHVKVLLSVAFHADEKARILPEHILKAGEEWTIPSLAANDKVIIAVEGHAPLELTVP